MNPARHHRATCQKGCPSDADNGISAAGEIDVVDYQGIPCGWRIATRAESCYDALWRADKLAVLKEDGAHSRVSWIPLGHIYANATVVDSERLEAPNPVPVHVDGRVAIIEGQVSSRKLLIPNEHAVFAAIEDQIGIKPTRAIVHKYAVLCIVGAALNHIEHNVLQAGSLSDLPVNAGSSSGRHTGNVNDQIADLPIELILVCVPVVWAVVRVSINDGHTREAG